MLQASPANAGPAARNERKLSDFTRFPRIVDARHVVPCSPRWWYGSASEFASAPLALTPAAGADSAGGGPSAGVVVVPWKHVDLATQKAALADVIPNPWTPEEIQARRDDLAARGMPPETSEEEAKHDHEERERTLEAYGISSTDLKFMCLDGRSVVQGLQKAVVAKRLDDSLPAVATTLAVEELLPVGPLNTSSLSEDGEPSWQGNALTKTEAKYLAADISAVKMCQRTHGIMDLLDYAAKVTEDVVNELGKPENQGRGAQKLMVHSKNATQAQIEAHDFLAKEFLNSDRFKAFVGLCGLPTSDVLSTTASEGKSLLRTSWEGNVLGSKRDVQRQTATERVKSFLKKRSGNDSMSGTAQLRLEVECEDLANTYLRLIENVDELPLTQVMLKLIDLHDPGCLNEEFLARRTGLFVNGRSDAGIAMFLFWYLQYCQAFGKAPVTTVKDLKAALDVHFTMLERVERQFSVPYWKLELEGALRGDSDILYDWWAILTREAKGHGAVGVEIPELYDRFMPPGFTSPKPPAPKVTAKRLKMGRTSGGAPSRSPRGKLGGGGSAPRPRGKLSGGGTAPAGSKRIVGQTSGTGKNAQSDRREPRTRKPVKNSDYEQSLESEASSDDEGHDDSDSPIDNGPSSNSSDESGNSDSSSHGRSSLDSSDSELNASGNPQGAQGATQVKGKGSSRHTSVGRGKGNPSKSTTGSSASKKKKVPVPPPGKRTPKGPVEPRRALVINLDSEAEDSNSHNRQTAEQHPARSSQRLRIKRAKTFDPDQSPVSPRPTELDISTGNWPGRRRGKGFTGPIPPPLGEFYSPGDDGTPALGAPYTAAAQDKPGVPLSLANDKTPADPSSSPPRGRRPRDEPAVPLEDQASSDSEGLRGPRAKRPKIVESESDKSSSDESAKPSQTPQDSIVRKPPTTPEHSEKDASSDEESAASPGSQAKAPLQTPCPGGEPKDPAPEASAERMSQAGAEEQTKLVNEESDVQARSESEKADQDSAAADNSVTPSTSLAQGLQAAAAAAGSGIAHGVQAAVAASRNAAAAVTAAASSARSPSPKKSSAGLPQSEVDHSPRQPVVNATVDVQKEIDRGYKDGENAGTEALNALFAKALHVPGSSGSAVMFTGSCELPEVASSDELGESVREIFEPALAIGIRVAEAFRTLRQIHSGCETLRPKDVASTGGAVCCKSLDRCQAKLCEPWANVCPCDKCMLELLSSKQGFAITTCPDEEMTAYASLFGQLVVRATGIYGVLKKDLAVDWSDPQKLYMKFNEQEEVWVLRTLSTITWRAQKDPGEREKKRMLENFQSRFPGAKAHGPDQGLAPREHFQLMTTSAYLRAVSGDSNRRGKSDNFVPYHLARSVRFTDASVGASLGLGLRAIGMVSDTGEGLQALAKYPQLIFSLPGAAEVLDYARTDNVPSEHTLGAATAKPPSFGALTAYRAPKKSCEKVTKALRHAKQEYDADILLKPTMTFQTTVCGTSSGLAVVLANEKLASRNSNVRLCRGDFKQPVSVSSESFAVFRDDLPYGFPRGIAETEFDGILDTIDRACPKPDKAKGCLKSRVDREEALLAFAVSALQARIHFRCLCEDSHALE